MSETSLRVLLQNHDIECQVTKGRVYGHECFSNPAQDIWVDLTDYTSHQLLVWLGY